MTVLSIIGSLLKTSSTVKMIFEKTVPTLSMPAKKENTLQIPFEK